MLLLRVAVSLTAILYGAGAWSGQGPQSLGASAAPLTAIVCGASLLAGFVTPFAGVVILLGAVRTIFGSHSDSRLIPLLIADLAAAVILLGPGALSFDARLFGRREIIIPRSSQLPKP